MQNKFFVQKPSKRVCYTLCLVVLMELAAALMLINLEGQVIMAYDEARHGVNGYEMLRNEDLIVHTYQGDPDFWNLKPPLSYWLIALNLHLFGFNCMAFRLHSVLASLTLILILALWMKKQQGMAASLLTMLFLILNPAVYGLNFARTGEADALHTLFVTLAMLGLLSSNKDIRWLYVSAVAFGFSFLAKSYHAAIIPVICLLYLIFTGNLKRLRLKHYLLLLVLGLLPILPWAIARYQRDGFTFFISMFTTDVVKRVSDGTASIGAGWSFYPVQLVMRPVVVVSGLLGALGFILDQGWRKDDRHIWLGLALWALMPPLLYSFSSFKLYHYIVPVMVPFALLGALGSLKLYKLIASRAGKRAFCAVLAAGCIALTAVNIQDVSTRGGVNSMQRILAEYLDRDIDSETHVYIQYADGQHKWMQNDMLRALLSGDVICQDGGVAAFMEDEEAALLVIDKAGMLHDLLEYCPVVYESANQYILSN